MAKLFTFGGGALGELGTGRVDDAKRLDAVAVTIPSAIDGQPIEEFALGTDHSMAVVGGRVYWWGLWGAHACPETSRGAAPQKPEVVPTPTPITELASSAHGSREDKAARDDMPCFPDGRVRSVACGGSNSFMLADDGEVFVLGSLRPPSGNPYVIRHLWGSAFGGATSRIKCVAAGWRHCLLLTEAGHVFALGDDEHGQCAGVNAGKAAVPVPSSAPLAGVAAGACHSVVWDSAGVAFAWGHAGSGRLGLGQTQHRRAPARVNQLLDPVCMVSCGANFTMFVANSGKYLWACGGNQYGQLGLGICDQVAREVPTRICFPRGSEEIVSIACGANHVLCMTRFPMPADRPQQRAVVWGWGCTSSGQLGRAEGSAPGAPQPPVRAAPEALADFLMPRPEWALAIAAGRSHSAVLAVADAAEAAARSEAAARRRQGGTVLVEKERQAEEIIDAFCAGLAGLPSGPSSAMHSPRTVPDSPRRSVGESFRRGNSPPRRERGRLVATGARSAFGGNHWPRASPSWSSVGQRQNVSPPHAARKQSSPEPVRRGSKLPEAAPRQKPPVSRVAPASHAVVADVNSVQATVVLGPSVEESEWSGIHKSLDGLGSMIANLGSMSSLEEQPPFETFHAGDSAAGGGHFWRREHAAQEKGHHISHEHPRDHSASMDAVGLQLDGQSFGHGYLQHHSAAGEVASHIPHSAGALAREPLHSDWRPPVATDFKQSDGEDSVASLNFSQRSGESGSPRVRAMRGRFRHTSARTKEVAHQDQPPKFIEQPSWLPATQNSGVAQDPVDPADRSVSPMRKVSATLTPLPVSRDSRTLEVANPAGLEPSRTIVAETAASTIHRSSSSHVEQVEDDAQTLSGRLALGEAENLLEIDAASPVRGGIVSSRSSIIVESPSFSFPQASISVEKPVVVLSTSHDRASFVIPSSSPTALIESPAHDLEPDEATLSPPVIRRTTELLDEHAIGDRSEQTFRSANESYVDLDISRNDPSLAGLHGIAPMQPNIGIDADMPSGGSEEASVDQPTEAEERRGLLDEDSDRRQDEESASTSTSESTSDSDDRGDVDEALLAGLGFGDAAEDGVPDGVDDEDDEGDWV